MCDVRIAGAAYLVWLGVTAIWKSRKPMAQDVEVPAAPKVGVFYMSLLPQFLPKSSSATRGVLLVADGR